MGEQTVERQRDENEETKIEPPDEYDAEVVEPSKANPVQQAWIYDLADRISIEIHHVQAHDHPRTPETSSWTVSTSPTAAMRGMLAHMSSVQTTEDGEFSFTLMIPRPGVDLNQHFPVETGTSSEPQVSK